MVDERIRKSLLLLLKNLNQAISNYLGKPITDNDLSLILGMGKRYIYRIRQELEQKKFYSITEKTLEKWKDNLKKKFQSEFDNLNHIIQVFKESQELYPFAQRTKSHPNLKHIFFDQIDNKKKAYWLGVLFADGNVSKKNRITFHQNKENQKLVHNFAKDIGFNSKFIKRQEEKILLRIGNKRLAAALKKHGCVPSKSKIIKLPKLKDRTLYLAFLLGYFDGDGTISTSKITSGIELPAPKGAGFLLPRPLHLNGVLHDLHKRNFP